MQLADYVETDPPGEGFQDAADLLRQWDMYSYRKLAGEIGDVDELLATRVGACVEYQRARGSYPLVMYSSGWYNRTPDNLRLAEFLAARGFVVVGVPQLNPALWTYQFASDPISVENQLRDLEVALGEVIGLPGVDRTRVAAMGYSTGGDLALLLQGRNPLIDAVIGLDSTWALGDDDVVADSPYFGGERNRKPILLLRRGIDGVTAAPGLEKLDRALRLVATVPGADHGTFSDDAWLAGQEGPGDSDTDTYDRICRTVHAFLQGVFRPPVAEAELVAMMEDLGWMVRALPASQE
ncbi:MAG: hypothetical protein R3200_03405 [Xanthomonadales bacterium]|nr:hypothetical protein [Xanthomonadales bacterium]